MLQFDNKLLLDIFDTAHRILLDKPEDWDYPTTTETWIQAIEQTLRREGYEIYIKRIDSDDNNYSLLRVRQS